MMMIKISTCFVVFILVSTIILGSSYKSTTLHLQKLIFGQENPTINLKVAKTGRLFVLFAEKRKGPADNDFISNFFSKLLPTPEDIGLSRYNRTSRPENYPCTKDEWASDIPGDEKDGDISLIRQLLAKTNLEYRPLKCLYDATKDGWKAEAFHSKVDKKGPCVVLARSIRDGVFGGYNPTGWVNYGEYRGSIAAFLFSFPEDGDSKTYIMGENLGSKKSQSDKKVRPIKLAKIAGAGLAQVDDGSGPKFGMEGLTIPLRSPSYKKALSKLGLYYEKMPSGENSLFKGNAREEELVSLRVFGGVYGPDEKIPYSDAMPFSLN